MWLLTFSLVAVHFLLFNTGRALMPEFSWEPPVYNATFEQYIDHSDPDLGVFQQRYWYNSEYWGGPGFPVVFTNSGEMDGTVTASSLVDVSLWVAYAKEIQGAVVQIEHRYWGESSPYEVQDAKALQYLTIDQTIADSIHFARTAQLPFDTDFSSNAPQAPWVSVGCSYPGMLAAWTDRFDSDETFWAHHAMCAPVQAIDEFWQYYDIIRMNMPQNCSQDFQRITEHVGDTITAGDPSEIAQLKMMFGAEDLENHDDFARMLPGALDTWQGIQVAPGGLGEYFYGMCDAIEGAVGNVSGSAVPAEGVGLEKALPNFASWFKTSYLDNHCANAVSVANNLTLYESFLSPDSVACFDTTYNSSSPVLIDMSPKSVISRRWWWLTCNEPTLWAFQVAPPNGRPSLISRTITRDYYAGICRRLFPPEEGYKYGLANGHTAETMNAHTGGWDYTNTTRLMWSNGDEDPWGTASVSSKFRPGGPLQSTEEVPVFVVAGGKHCSEMDLGQRVDPGMKAVQDAEIAVIKKWVAEFYAQKNSTGCRK